MRKRNAHSAEPAQSPEVSGLEWASQARFHELPWLWPGCIPASTLTMFEGRKATGKSTVLAAIAASVSGGPVIPGWSGPRNGRVLWFGSEESWEAVTGPRLQRAGADLSRIARFTGVDGDGRRQRLVLPDHLGELRALLQKAAINLVVLDPYISVISPAVDTRHEQAIRSVLEPLLDLAWQSECSFILVRHLRKGRSGDAREAGLGGSALTNVCRSLLRLDEHPHLPGHSILSPVAVSAAARIMPGQVLKIDYAGNGPPVTWIGATDLDSQTVAEGLGDVVERGETRDAERLLVELIGDSWVRQTVISKEGESAGIGMRSLRRAKERLLVPSRRVSYAQEGYWEWGPPQNGWPASVQHLLDTREGTHTQGGAMPAAAHETKRQTRKTRQGAKAPPKVTRTSGALPTDPDQESDNGKATD